jgi:hypothetical protein
VSGKSRARAEASFAQFKTSPVAGSIFAGVPKELPRNAPLPIT